MLEAAPHDVIPTHEPIEALRERPRSTPPVRKLAKELGVDLALVEASGATGLITRADVESYRGPHRGARTAGACAEEPRRATPAERTTRIPIRGVRKHTADAMVRSAFTAPHVTTFHTVDVTATSELIASLRADRALEGHRIGVMAVAAKAVCLALMRHPSLNSRWDADAAEIVAAPLREPRHRRGHRARARGAQHPRRRGDDPRRARRRDRAAGRGRARGQDGAEPR